ncbi:MAG: S8 family serine peptidase [Pseudomonadales bacterium]|nr:S8 family serine peptidase [Pseudomonadales bacterium]
MRLSLLILLVCLTGCQTAGYRDGLEERLSRQIVFTVDADIKAAGLAGSVGSQDENTDRQLEALINRIIRSHHLVKVSEWSIGPLGIRAVLVEVAGNDTRESAAAKLAADERVESVQFVSRFDLLSYNDPYVHLQGGIQEDNIESVHEIATGKNVIVGILDTGIDRTHPELADKIVFARNFVAHDPGRFDFDDHGTAVAGVIASSANNHLGIVGVAPDVSLMAFKACWQDPASRRAACDSASIVKAMVAVLEQQPHILNLSIAGPPDPLIRRLIERAVRQGMIVVAAVDEQKPAQTFPASMPEVIGVGNSQTAGPLPPGSVIAPGVDVLTTAPGATYVFKSGSSISTAFVSGAAALLKERMPALSVDEFRAQLAAGSGYSLHASPVLDICQLIAWKHDGNPCLSAVVIATDKDKYRINAPDQRGDGVRGTGYPVY